MQKNYEKLIAPFSESELEWRPQSVGVKNGKAWALVMPYVQARAIQRRLDDVFGFDGWQVKYRAENTNTKNQANIICTISVNTDRGWVYKEDGATETNIEAFKGGISSALKRCASSGFGIGRYLYDLDAVYADCKLEKVIGWNRLQHKDKWTKEEHIIYWKTPNINGCKKISQPVGVTEPEKDEDLDLLLGVDMCDTVQEVRKYYLKHKKDVKNHEALVAKCAERKAAINGNN